MSTTANPHDHNGHVPDDEKPKPPPLTDVLAQWVEFGRILGRAEMVLDRYIPEIFQRLDDLEGVVKDIGERVLEHQHNEEG